MDLEYKIYDGIKIGLYKNGPVGIGISGGADSAVLLYILMSNVVETIHIYNMMAEFRRPALEKHVINVINKCSELTGNTNYVIHQNFVEPDGSAEYYINMLKNAMDTKEVDIIYLGLTKFPPFAEILKWPVEQQPNWHNKFRSYEEEKSVFGFEIPVELADDFKRVPLTIDGKPIDKLALDSRAYIPLFNHDKKDIAKLYRILNVESTLLPVTRSCENDHHVGSHCKKCWWCYERKYGFGYIETPDEES